MSAKQDGESAARDIFEAGKHPDTSYEQAYYLGALTGMARASLDGGGEYDRARLAEFIRLLDEKTAKRSRVLRERVAQNAK